MVGVEDEEKGTTYVNSVSIECVRSKALGGILTLIGVRYAMALDYDLLLDYYRKLAVASPSR